MKRLYLPIKSVIKNMSIGLTLISLIVGCTLPFTSGKLPTPTPISAADYLQLGDDALFESKYDLAENLYQEVLAIEPEDASALSRLAYLKAVQIVSRTESMAMIDEVVESAPDVAEPWAFHSLVYLRNYQINGAVTSAEKAIEIEPQNAWAQIARCQASRILRDAEAAQQAAEEALKVSPEHPEALICLSYALADNGQIDAAIEAAKQVFDQAPFYIFSILALADSHIMGAEFTEAESILDQGLIENPDDLHLILAKINLYQLQNRLIPAGNELEKARALGSDLPEVKYAQGNHRLYLESPYTAVELFNELIEKYENYWPGHLGRGWSNYELSNCEEAIEDFMEVLRRYPQSGSAHLGLALSFTCQGEYERAEEGISSALELEPFDPQIQMEIGSHYFNIDDIEEGKLAFDAALIRGMFDPVLYTTIGYSQWYDYAGLGTIKSEFEQALRIAKHDIEAGKGLGFYFLGVGDFKKARDIFQQVIKDSPYDEDALYGLGQAYLYLESYPMAIQNMNQARSYHLTHWMLFVQLAQAYRLYGDDEEAARILGYALEDENLPEFVGYRIYNTGMSLLEGNYWMSESDAEAYIVKSAMATPDSPLEMSVAEMFDIPTFDASAQFETQDTGKRMKISVRIKEAGSDDDSLLITIEYFLLLGSFTAARVSEPLQDGLVLEIFEQDGTKIIEVYLSYRAILDCSDGVVLMPSDILESALIVDLRPTNEFSDRLEAMETIAENVETLRGIRSSQEITFDIISQDELADKLNESVSFQSLEHIQASHDLLVLLGLLERGDNLEEKILEARLRSISGFYVPEERKFYLVSDEEGELGVSEIITLCHEYVHALQDQSYGLREMEQKTSNEDEQLALRAVVEGEAQVVSHAYFDRYLTPLQQQSFWSGLNDDNHQDGIVFIGDVFTYIEGENFIDAVAPGGYWPSIEAVFIDPPTSSEQVLHPEKFLEGSDPPLEVDIPDFSELLGPSWNEIAGNVMGEFHIRAYLAGHISPSAAELAAAGWGGDRYVLFENEEDGRDILVWKVEWDTVEDARQFVLAHRLNFEFDDRFEEIERDLHAFNRTLQWQGETRSVFIRQMRAVTWIVVAQDTVDLDLITAQLDEME